MKDNINEKVSDKILKLSALVERGIGGEALNAKRALDRLLGKYGITLEDLLNEKPKQRVFAYKTADEMKLFYWIITHNFGSKGPECKSATYDSKGKRLFIYLKDSDYVDIRGEFDFYRTQYRKEFERLQKDFRSAFVHKHDLYDIDPGDPDKKSPYDAEDIMRILQMSESLENVSYHKQIEG